MEFTDFSSMTVRGLTPEIVRAIKDRLRTLEGLDFSLLTSGELMQIQEDINAFRFFMPMILVEGPINDIVRVTKNPCDGEGHAIRIHQISRLKYPPMGKVKIEMGRANFPDVSVLYGSFFGLTSLREMRIEPGDLITRTEWRMITYLDRIKATCIFHDARILERLPYFKNFNDSYRALLSGRPPLESEVIQATNNFMARHFMKKVPSDKKVNYLVSAFVSNLWLNQNKLDAIVYPSVQLDQGDACIAMRPDIFDYMFYPVRSREMLAGDGVGEYTAVATDFDEENDIIHWDLQKSFSEEQLAAFQEQRAEERARASDRGKFLKRRSFLKWLKWLRRTSSGTQ